MEENDRDIPLKDPGDASRQTDQFSAWLSVPIWRCGKHEALVAERSKKGLWREVLAVMLSPR